MTAEALNPMFFAALVEVTSTIGGRTQIAIPFNPPRVDPRKDEDENDQRQAAYRDTILKRAHGAYRAKYPESYIAQIQIVTTLAYILEDAPPPF